MYVTDTLYPPHFLIFQVIVMAYGRPKDSMILTLDLFQHNHLTEGHWDDRPPGTSLLQGKSKT